MRGRQAAVEDGRRGRRDRDAPVARRVTRDTRACHASTCGGIFDRCECECECESAAMSTALRRSALRSTSRVQALRAWAPAAPALRLSRSCRRAYSQASSSSSLLQLPPPEDWYTIFERSETDRAMLKRMDTARLVADSFLGDKSPVGGDGKVVIEAFPGTPPAVPSSLRSHLLARTQVLVLCRAPSWNCPTPDCANSSSSRTTRTTCPI